ncbi:MAG: tetratricopeptide repeat protein [Gammaproteobacteria bacterium]|nr:MAG: tetratricopeptide repeat protein [Gammaproteobacteria bacterium]
MKLAGKPYEIHLLAVIVLYVLGFVVYLNSFPVPFVFDDYPNIRDNPSIRLTAIDLEELHVAGFESPLGRRPVANISFALNYLAGGYDVKGYHLVNILIHIVNGVLVYFLALILLRKNQTLAHRKPASERRLRSAAFFAAAIFIAHPVQIQTVTYIVQRMTSMATMFYLMSLLFYLLGRQRNDRSGRSAYWLAALASWLLALGSKEIAATLPVVILLVEYFLFRDPEKAWPGISRGYLLFALAASASVVLFYLGVEPAATIAGQYVDREFTPGERVLTELRVLVFYLSLMLFPYPGRLSLEHTFTISHSLVDPMTTLVAAAVLVALLFTALRLARRHPILSFCLFWFLVTLSIESSFVGLELAFEHRLYLPMFAFALAVAYLFSLTPLRYRAAVTTLAGTLVVMLMAGAIVRNMVWQDRGALWADTVSKNPTSHRARNNLGRVLTEQGKHEQAARQFGAAIGIKPDYAEPHNNLGTLHARAGRFDEAQAHFATAIDLNPQYAQAYNNSGVALLSQGLAYQAAVRLSQAVRLTPGYANAHANLSTALTRLGRPQAACRQLRIALRLDPSVLQGRAMPSGCQSDSKSD